MLGHTGLSERGADPIYAWCARFIALCGRIADILQMRRTSIRAMLSRKLKTPAQAWRRQLPPP